jgi:formate hydrogenlyase subunit 3/multisubunit Na+/H+ antiporter MnhD subunit
MMANFIVAVIMIPLVFAMISFIFANYAKRLGLAFSTLWLTVAAFLFYEVTNNALIYEFAGFAAPLGIIYVATPLGALMVLLSAVILFCITLYTVFSNASPIFYPLAAFLACGLGVVFLSNDIFNIYVGLEITGLSAVALTAYSQKKQNIQAAIQYFFATLLGSGFYLLGVALLYARYGVLDITLLAQLSTNDLPTFAATVCVVAGLSLKTALFPFHFWLPKAHANAVAPISALLSALVVKASFYLIYRFYYELFSFDFIAEILTLFGIVAIFYGGFLALYAKTIKLLIAYSTLSQLGYLFLVFSIDADIIKQAMVFHLISHALAKGGLFLAAGAILLSLGEKNIGGLKGLGSKMPIVAFVFGLSTLTLIGLPPSLGFVAKWQYLVGAFAYEQMVVVVALLGGGILSAAYLFKILLLSLQTPPKGQQSQIRLKSTFVMQWIAFTLSFSSVALGFFANAIEKGLF